MSTGIVVRSTGSRYIVRDADGVLHDCVAKGTLRAKGWNSTNPLAVGDHVEFTPQVNDEIVGAITDLHDRKNYLVRRSVNLSHHKHVIAANIDQVILMATVARPRTSFGFIDRFLVTAETYQVPAIVVVNKIDDLDKEEEELLFDLVDVYQQAGYRVIMTSAMKNKGVAEVAALLAGRVTLLSGHSGVGKSTLINAIDPELDLFTLEVSEASGKGVHTTTNAEMYELRDKKGKPLSADALTFVIDTPGIKGFGLVDIEKEHIGDQFPEMFRLKSACRFNNCLHKEEPGCAVRKALEREEIAASRYRSYIDMLNGVDDESSFRVD
ncbi:MAG TPA: ribosome small subunit-dependent GTPase A [Flavobacteriales bacterium]|nr:ribosome small subunit-dependent GTPase A [Flavobacteriales bacterium]